MAKKMVPVAQYNVLYLPLEINPGGFQSMTAPPGFRIVKTHLVMPKESNIIQPKAVKEKPILICILEGIAGQEIDVPDSEQN